MSARDSAARLSKMWDSIHALQSELDAVKAERDAMRKALEHERHARDCKEPVVDRPRPSLCSCAALTPKRKSHVCVTRSGDEQVTCDDVKCPKRKRSER